MLYGDFYLQGVHVHLETRPNGSLGLAKVKFDHNSFNKEAADKWWAENKQDVFRRFNLTPPESGSGANPRCEGPECLAGGMSVCV